MQVDTIIQNVMDVFRRPDMAVQVAQRVRGAILWAHNQDYFPRDRITQMQTVQQFENSTIRLGLPPYFRQFEVVRPFDANDVAINLSTDTPDSVGYREIDPKQIIGYRNSEEINWYYVAGDVLNIRTNVTPVKLYFMYYATPDLRSDNAVTWITEQYQEMVEFRALGVLYSIIGNQELRNTYMNLANENLEIMLDNAFQSGGA